jgi:hypothetical protein
VINYSCRGDGALTSIVICSSVYANILVDQLQQQQQQQLPHQSPNQHMATPPFASHQPGSMQPHNQMQPYNNSQPLKQHGNAQEAHAQQSATAASGTVSRPGQYDTQYTAANVQALLGFYTRHDVSKATYEQAKMLLTNFSVVEIREALTMRYGDAPMFVEQQGDLAAQQLTQTQQHVQALLGQRRHLLGQQQINQLQQLQVVGGGGVQQQLAQQQHLMRHRQLSMQLQQVQLQLRQMQAAEGRLAHAHQQQSAAAQMRQSAGLGAGRASASTVKGIATRPATGSEVVDLVGEDPAEIVFDLTNDIVPAPPAPPAPPALPAPPAPPAPPPPQH